MRYLSYCLILCFFSATSLANSTLEEIHGILSSRNVVQASAAINNAHIATDVAVLSSNYKFIFFYRTSCPHCQRFGAILKQYLITSKIAVQAFTFDNAALPYFPDSTNVDPTLVSVYFGGASTIAVPALFIMNTQNLHVYPVASGELSYLDLVTRMNELTPKILQNEAREGGHYE